MFGLLNINKPQGQTSRDVVNHVQRFVRPVKVGHAGTLDPLATGVLIVTVGRATRLTQYVQRMRKSYRGTFMLGRKSDTDDVQGNVTILSNVSTLTLDDIERVLPDFMGRIHQHPPAFSALKINGRRAHALARAGAMVELPSRPVDVYELRVVSYEHPRLVLDVQCGSGTYIRALGRDIAASLGTGAVMLDLTRTAIGHFSIDPAIGMDELSGDALQRNLLSPLEALRALPSITLSDHQRRRILHGMEISCPEMDASEVAATDNAGRLISVLVRRCERKFRPKLNFQAP